MKEPLTRASLDPVGCGAEGCEHDHTRLYFHARCHQDKRVEAYYDKATGHIVVTCSVCGRPAARILVAEA